MPPVPCFPSLSKKELSPRDLGAQGIAHQEMRALDTRWGPDADGSLKSVKE